MTVVVATHRVGKLRGIHRARILVMTVLVRVLVRVLVLATVLVRVLVEGVLTLMY
jgi:hypothetical protein